MRLARLETSNERDDFVNMLNKSVKDFNNNSLLKLVVNGKFNVRDYHNFLLMIFHQTYHAASTFALAGSMCTTEHMGIKQYLIRHADEEKDHWEWVISDLVSTGYTGVDPRNLFPSFACQSYISLNYYLALQHPICRLGTAAFLEAVGAANGKKTAQKIVSLLNLKEDQVKFIYGHGDTDVGHTREIIDILTAAELNNEEWSQLIHAMVNAKTIYYSMFEEVAAQHA